MGSASSETRPSRAHFRILRRSPGGATFPSQFDGLTCKNIRTSRMQALKMFLELSSRARRSHTWRERALSNLSAIVGPVQQCLSLPLAAGKVALLTIPSDLRDMPFDLLPAPDLPRVFFRHAAPHIVAAVPLEPAARIVGMQPAFPAPDGQRLACVDPEEIQRRLTLLWGKF